ncbi:MAG TPA: UDP-N-acetylmuramoyl-L-alanine--D-glutamate ligase [Acidimicrobiales bacterium]|nr:UDP-N-acetylmuramoyl-L-alanine--D-glutamate ligase [Acidimicrobiales bacterium]
MRALVIGLGVAGESAARAMQARGWNVTVVEDRPTDAARARADALGLPLRGPDEALALVDAADVVVPSPPVPYGHPAIQRALARGTKVWTEFELAAQWSDVPIVAITGTDGKTTVTTLVERMLTASGRRTAAVGNNETPLVDVLEDGLDVIVVEASSFRLQFIETFRPAVGVWLNLAPDHLDWHGSMEHYGAAKARIWENQTPDDLAVANAEDDEVMRYVRKAHSRLETFGINGGDWHVQGNRLLQPDGEVLITTNELWRSLPHDLSNVLAASAAALGGGATLDGVRDALRAFRGLPHRVSLVGDHGGVQWYDDSKATGPNAVRAAVRAFDSVVLIAGGRNKGVDLGALADEIDRIRGVVAIGESAADVEAVFIGRRPVVTATSMDDAVARAAELAKRGDVVLLSPGCASFDWYTSYAERGDDFARAVQETIGGAA